MSTHQLVLLCARVCAATLLVAGVACAQAPRLFWGQFEIVGPVERVSLVPLRGGRTDVELDLATDERRVLELPVPLHDAVDLEFGDGPRIDVVGAGSAHFVAWSPAPRLARVPRVLTTLARPVAATARLPTPWPAALVTLAATIVCVALARRLEGTWTASDVEPGAKRGNVLGRATPLIVVAVLGAAASAMAVQVGQAEPADVVCVDRLFVPAPLEEVPRLVQRALRGPWLTGGDWRGVLETVPVGAPVSVRAELGRDGLSVAIEAPGAALLVLDVVLPASGGAGDPWSISTAARRTWRDEQGRWWSVQPDGALTGGTAPTRAFASAGLPLGRSALVAVEGDHWWRVLDLPRERAASLDQP